MILTETEILEFQEACHRHGFDLDRAEAAAAAQRMLRLYQIICRELPEKAVIRRAEAKRLRWSEPCP